MKAFQLTKEQIAKLTELVKAISPSYKLQATSYDGSFVEGHKHFTWWYVSDGESELIGWFEFCMTELSGFVVKEYAQANNQQLSWSHRLIMQKLGHELPSHNPIDTLYEIFKNPNGYTQGL